MNYRDRNKPPLPNMLWSDKYQMWIYPDNRSAAEKASDEKIAKELEERNEVYKKLQKRFHKDVPPFVMVGVGWSKLLYDLAYKLDKTRYDWHINRVKSQDGQLHFWAGVIAPDEEVEEKFFKLIRKAEEKSLKICERCGQKGSPQDVDGWVETTCPECTEKRRKA